MDVPAPTAVTDDESSLGPSVASSRRLGVGRRTFLGGTSATAVLLAADSVITRTAGAGTTDPTGPVTGLATGEADLRDGLERGGSLAQASAGAVERRTRDGPRHGFAAVSITDFGAAGDGVTDDTAAFETAFAAINAAGRPATLFVPAPPGGSYRLWSIALRPLVPITILGERSRIRRVDNATQQPGYTFSEGRMFNVVGDQPGAVDAFGYYPRVTFKDIVFDGNRDNQVQPNGAPWERDFGLQWFHAVSVEADHAQPWRQPAVFIGCDFEYCNGEGISLFANASVHAERCRFYGCFRGGLTVVGGYIELVARDCVSDDPLDTPYGMHSGLYFEYEPEGYRRANFVHIDGWTFHQGEVNVVTHGDAPQVGGRTVAPLLPGEKNDYILRGLRVMSDNRSGQIKFYNSGEANFLISDSIFYGGRQDDPNQLIRRTMIDGRNIECHNCVFVASNNGRPPATDPALAFYSAVMIRDFNENTHGRQRHRFLGCRFLLDETCHDSAPVYAIATDYIGNALTGAAPWAAGFQPPFISFDGCTFGYLKYYPDRDRTRAPAIRKFDYLFKPTLGTSVRFAHCDGYAVRGFRLEQGQAGLPGYYEFVGGNYAVDEALIEIGMPVGEPAELLALRFSGFWTEDRWNHFLHTEAWAPAWDHIRVWGGREVMVVSDPTTAGPVPIADRLLLDVVRQDNRYRIRLEGTPVVPGSLTITNQNTGAALADDGAGALTGAGTGTVDYAAGVMEFRWTTPPDGLDRIVHGYRHGNAVPGFRGDVAVLKSDPSRRWICTAASPTAATWTALWREDGPTAPPREPEEGRGEGEP